MHPHWFNRGSPFWVSAPIPNGSTDLVSWAGSPIRKSRPESANGRAGDVFISRRIVVLGFFYASSGTPSLRLGWRPHNGTAVINFHHNPQATPQMSVPNCYIPGPAGIFSPEVTGNNPADLVVVGSSDVDGSVTIWGTIEDSDVGEGGVMPHHDASGTPLTPKAHYGSPFIGRLPKV